MLGLFSFLVTATIQHSPLIENWWIFVGSVSLMLRVIADIFVISCISYYVRWMYVQVENLPKLIWLLLQVSIFDNIATEDLPKLSCFTL